DPSKVNEYLLTIVNGYLLVKPVYGTVGVYGFFTRRSPHRPNRGGDPGTATRAGATAVARQSGLRGADARAHLERGGAAICRARLGNSLHAGDPETERNHRRCHLPPFHQQGRAAARGYQTRPGSAAILLRAEQ